MGKLCASVRELMGRGWRPPMGSRISAPIAITPEVSERERILEASDASPDHNA